MPPMTAAALWLHLATAVLAAIPATIVALAAWRSSKGNASKLTEIHVLVNGKSRDLEIEIEALRAELHARDAKP